MEEFFRMVLIPLLYPLVQNQRIYCLYLASALIIATWLYTRHKGQNEDEAPTLLAYLFPAEIYKHPSARQDYFFFYFNTILQTLILFPFFTFVTPSLSLMIQGGMDRMGIAGQGTWDAGTLTSSLVFTLLLATFADFGIFLAHYLQHKTSWLWEFHKVHHSAKVLTPITVYRVHPVDNFLAITLASCCTGIGDGFFQYFYGGEGTVINILGLNMIVALYYLLGYNLRHSHIWVDYGPFWSRLLISPAQHQIHHSAEERHFDRNFGFIFSFWDACFQTLYIPQEKEMFALGIDEQDMQKMQSVWSLYWVPFANLQKLFGFRKPNWKQFSYVVVFMLIGICGMTLARTYTDGLPDVDRKVYLENLTWQEVDARIKEGYTTIIVPTGGTEQNGPHMVLGKHNYIVSYTSGRIATVLGRTLVAPVLAYVPEGNIDDPSEHMRFSGTISIPEPVFEEVLKNTAKSLKKHGFKTILFVGDSAGNQNAQLKVAKKLRTQWRAEDIQVFHIGNYYAKNGQMAWLQNRNLTFTEIGGHAGIRDTSELMLVFPEGIRKDKMGRHDTMEAFNATGAHGNALRANEKDGRFMLELKIRAAVRQIQTLQRASSANP